MDSSLSPSIVRLDIGGKKFSTSIDTLTRREPDSMLAAMFNGIHTLSQDSEGYVFIDRDGKHFRHILNWLRDGVVPSPSDVNYSELLREAEYYQLLGLISGLNAAVNERKGEDDLDVADLTRGDIIKCIQFNGVKFRGVNLSGLNLSKLQLDGIDFSYACLKDVNFSSAVLSKASFEGANLCHANLQEACLRQCSFVEVDLRSAHLQSADFTDVNLEGANLKRANLKNANLNKANLEGANLEGANLDGVNLLTTKIHGANFRGAIFGRSSHLRKIVLESLVSRGINLDEEIKITYTEP